jgi:hypothetical protein
LIESIKKTLAKLYKYSWKIRAGRKEEDAKTSRKER